jgi:hypothetical protein
LGINLTLSPCPGKAVMLGAVRFGLFPSLFSTRISKYTYGVSAVMQGQSACFDEFVGVGEGVPFGTTLERHYKPLHEAQEWICVEIFASNCSNVQTTMEPSCKLLATLRIKVPMNIEFLLRNVVVVMSFGSTEINARASIVGGDVIESTLTFNTPLATTSASEIQMMGSLGETGQFEAGNLSGRRTNHGNNCRSVHFLLDVSDSMNCTSRGRVRLEDAVRGLYHVIDNVLVSTTSDASSFNRMSLSTFSTKYQSIFSEVVVDLAPMEAIDSLQAFGSTAFYSSCVKELKRMELLMDGDRNNIDIIDYSMQQHSSSSSAVINRFLLVFTDGVDDSRDQFDQDTGYQELLFMLNDEKGVCSKLAGFLVISIGLNESSLIPLKLLEATKKVKLITFEQFDDISAAFAVASEEIEKLCT